MAESDNTAWESLAAHGFYFNTDPQRSITIDEKAAIDKQRKADVPDKMVSAILDTPVAIYSKAGELAGRSAQYISEQARKGAKALDQIPGLNKVDDGLKYLDKSGALNALANGELPGGEAFTNFTQKTTNRIEKFKNAPWIGKIAAFPATLTSYSIKAIMPEPWDKVINGITLKLTRDLLSELAQVLVDWYQDPKTLCCLIKNLAAIGSMIKNKSNLEEELNKSFNGTREFLGSDYFTTIDTLKKIKEFLDIIIDLISTDFSSDLLSGFDFGKELSDMLLGIINALLDAAIITGRQAWYDKVSGWFKDLRGINRAELQCLPLEKLIDVLFRFMSSDHGLFNVLKRYLDEYTRYLKWRFIKNFKEKYINREKDLRFLRFLRDLIDKIIQALENFQICIEADYMEVDVAPNPLTDINNNSDMCPYGISSQVTSNWTSCPYRTLTNNNILCRVSDQVPNTNGRASYCNHPDAVNNYFNVQSYNPQQNIGNILNKSSKIGDKNQVAVVFPTDNEVKNFLINSLGYSPTQAEQVVIEGQNNNSKIEGSLGKVDTSEKTNDGRNTNLDKDLINRKNQLMSALGDCAKTLNPQTIADLANRLTDVLK